MTTEIFYTIQKSEEFEGATVTIDGDLHTVSKDNPNFDIIKGILTGDGYYEDTQGEYDYDDLLALINPVAAVSTVLTRVSERVTIGGNVLYFDGDPIHSSLADHILRVFGEPAEDRTVGFKNLVAFLEKLMQNPSEVSRQHVYDFVDHHGLTITETGDVLFYKYTNGDGKATHSGYGIVTTADGTVTVYKNDYLPNAVGNIVEIPREMVDEDRNSACSVGLHVGAYSYSGHGGSRLFNVLVNPRDIVAVPHDASSAKVRVCRYTIAGENPKRTEYKATSVKTAEVSTPIRTKTDQEKIAAHKETIRNLQKSGWTKSISSYKNKRITSGQRDLFQVAMDELGVK